TAAQARAAQRSGGWVSSSRSRGRCRQRTAKMRSRLVRNERESPERGCGFTRPPPRTLLLRAALVPTIRRQFISFRVQLRWVDEHAHDAGVLLGSQIASELVSILPRHPRRGIDSVADQLVLRVDNRCDSATSPNNNVWKQSPHRGVRLDQTAIQVPL